MNKLLSCAILLSAASINAEQCELVSTATLNQNICIESNRSPNVCKMRKEVAEALNAVQQELEKRNLNLKIYEAHCQPCQDEWVETSDGTYIPMPEECKRHCLGTSVDVTLVTKEGQELEMPCAFDDFCAKAKRNCMQAPDNALINRDLLEDIMVKHGFVPSENSWWHFDIQNWQSYKAVCDLSSDCARSCDKECMEACEQNCTDNCDEKCINTCKGECPKP